jgi:transposase-like protein
MKEPKTLQQAIQYFSEEQTCIDAVAAMRWPNGVVCGLCGADSPYYLQTQKRWKCRKCRKQFSVKVNSIFEDSPISLTKWLPALWLIVNCKNGVSSYEIARDLGVTQKSAWFMLQRLRLALRARDFSSKLGGNDGGAVEVDECYIGGKTQFMHKSRKLRIQREKNEIPAWKSTAAYYGKTPVMGIFDRDTRQVRAKVVPNVKRETLQAEILENIEHGSAIYSDEAVAYHNLREKFVHETVNHLSAYVRGQVHTNCLENFWSLTKRSLKGTYVCVEPFHLDRYIDEQVFRFNHRATKDNPLNDSDRFLLALSQVANKRLTYAELTGKASTTPA